MTAAQQLADLAEATRRMVPCVVCQERPTVIYEPGVTFARCRCGEHTALPDWKPLYVPDRWRGKGFKPSRG